jgi:hypothetical protein
MHTIRSVGKRRQSSIFTSVHGAFGIVKVGFPR